MGGEGRRVLPEIGSVGLPFPSRYQLRKVNHKTPLGRTPVDENQYRNDPLQLLVTKTIIGSSAGASSPNGRFSSVDRYGYGLGPREATHGRPLSNTQSPGSRAQISRYTKRAVRTQGFSACRGFGWLNRRDAPKPAMPSPSDGNGGADREPYCTATVTEHHSSETRVETKYVIARISHSQVASTEHRRLQRWKQGVRRRRFNPLTLSNPPPQNGRL